MTDPPQPHTSPAPPPWPHPPEHRHQPPQLYFCLPWQQPCALAGSCPKMLVINQCVILLDWCGPLSTAADTSSGSRMERMNHSDTRPDKCISHSINKRHWSWKLLVASACAAPSHRSRSTIWFRISSSTLLYRSDPETRWMGTCRKWLTEGIDLTIYHKGVSNDFWYRWSLFQNVFY